MTFSDLKQKLQQTYDRDAWQDVLRGVFPRVDIHRQPTSIQCDHPEVESFFQLGNVRLHDDKSLAIFEIALTPKKKIQRNRVELRNLVARHIDQERNHGVLVIFTGQNEDYRFTFTAKESEFNDDGEFVERQTATKRFTYLLGPHETCTTAARRLSQLAEKQDKATLTDVVDAFSVEKLNKEFFNLYKEHYSTFVNHLLAGTVPQQVFGIPRLADDKEQDKANKPVRDFAKRLLGRLVFLHFIQKKGWLGCPAGRTDWIDGERDFVRNLFQSCPDKEKFYSTRLVPLFFEALNRPDRPNAIFPVTGTRVPYLNGGLFEHEKLPNDHKPLPVEQLDFPSVLFEQVLEFFGQYNFTIDENDPDDHEVGIDPEMLGHIFENLLEDNKDKGAFYTPKAIVQYMCQQSLIHYLQQHLGERDELVQLVRFKDAGSATDKTNWVRQNAKQIEELLDNLKICDPAIGSGAFPIGLLQEIYWIKLTLDWTLDAAETKLKIIQNSIYGVDIDAGAVEIARLRFWLSLIVDEDEPRPLPNLDYKIMQGDSLLESFEGIPLDNLQQSKGFNVEVFSKQGQGQMFPGNLLEYSQSHESAARAKEISSLINKYFGVTNPAEKQELHKQIDRFVLDHIDYNLQIQEEKFSDELQLRNAEIKRKAGLVKGWKPAKKDEQRLASLEDGLKSIALKKEKLQELEEKPERPYFLWHLFFQDVFEQGGFDIIIGNPPYVRPHNLTSEYKEKLWANFKTFEKKADLYVCFIERAIELLRQHGQFAFIVSNGLLRLDSFEKLRKLILSSTTIKAIIDFDKDVFESATVKTCVLMFENCKAEKTTTVNLASASAPKELLNLSFNSVPQYEFDTRYKSIIDFATDPAIDAVKDSIRRNTVELHNIFDISFGLKTGDDDRFLSMSASTSEHRRLLRGEDIGKYSISFKGEYVWYVPEIMRQHRKTARPGEASRFEQPKVLVRDTGSGLMATYDNDNYYVKDVLIISHSNRSESTLKKLAAVLNSHLMRFYYETSFPTLHVQRDELSVLPLIEDIFVDGNAEELPILIDQILSIKNPTDLSYYKIDDKINSCVYRLYGLNSEEIKLIETALNKSLSKKDIICNQILLNLKEKYAYFSLAAVKQALTETEIELADDTLREYMSEAMSSGIVSDAGRGWYSRHTKPVGLDPKPVAKIIRAVKKAFPLLDFCCWSTIQFNPFALHLIAQPTIFLYAEGDTLNSVADTLKENGWDAWADPGKNEVDRYIKPGDRTVILRPSIQKQPESNDQITPIEKALVDLKIEASKLHLMDSTEVQRIIDAVLGSGLLQVTALLGYSEVKREKIESAELTH